MDTHLIVVDVETRRPSSNEICDWVTRDIQPDARLKDPDKIAASISERTYAAIADTPLRPMYGEIGCIAWHCGGVTQSVCHEDEAHVLGTFVDFLRTHRKANNNRPPKWVGFNVGFDLRYLWTRLLVHDIRPPVPLEQAAPPWSDRVIDLRHILSCGDRYAKGTLQDWMVALGYGARESDIPGADIPDAFAQQRLEAIEHHCRQDVDNCVVLYERIFQDA